MSGGSVGKWVRDWHKLIETGERVVTFKKIALLACIVGVLSLFVFQVEMPRIEQERMEKVFLGGLKPEELKKIEIQRASGGFTLLNSKVVPLEKVSKIEKSPFDGQSVKSEWYLEGKPDAMLDVGSVDGLLNALTDLELGDAIPKEDIEGDWGVYGLIEPEVTVIASWKDKTATVDLGKKSEYLGDRYARVRDTGDLYLIPDTLYFASNKGTNDIRDKTPIDINVDDVNKLVLDVNRKDSAGATTVTSQVRIVKNDGVWILESSQSARADEAAISELTRKLRSLEVLNFHDEGISHTDNYDLETPDVKLSFTGEAEPFSVGISSSKDGNTFFNIPAQGKTVYEVGGSKVGDFLIGESQLIDRSVFTFNSIEVEKAEFDLNGNSLLLQSFGEGEKTWQVDGKPGEPAIIGGFLDNISNLQVEGLADQDAQVDFKPILTFKVYEKGGEAIVFEIGDSKSQSDGGFHLLKRIGWQGMYKISEDTYSSLVPKKEAFAKIDG